MADRAQGDGLCGQSEQRQRLLAEPAHNIIGWCVECLGGGLDQKQELLALF